MRVGTELLAALMVGGGLGWAADAYVLSLALSLEGTEPWGMVVGLILGLIAGVHNAYRSAQRLP